MFEDLLILIIYRKWGSITMSKKYKIFIGILSILLILGCGFAFYSSSQEKESAKQKTKIETYINKMIESDSNIQDRLFNIKSKKLSTANDHNYIEQQIQNIANNYASLYQYNKIKYLDEYTKEKTNFENYEKYYKSLISKYNFQDHENYSQTVDRLINNALN